MFRPQFWNDVLYFIVYILISKQLMAIMFVLLLLPIYKAYPSPLFKWVSSWPFWWQLGYGLLVVDLFMYWIHRITHAIPPLWRIHAIHHSLTKLDTIGVFRMHPLERVVLALGGPICLYISGFPLEWLVVVGAFIHFHQIWLHSNLHIPFYQLKWLIGTTQYHHWHHDPDPNKPAKNFGNITPIWDWMFGTLYLPQNDRLPSEYGSTEPVPTGFLNQLLYPFQAQAGLTPPNPSSILPFQPTLETKTKQAG